MQPAMETISLFLVMMEILTHVVAIHGWAQTPIQVAIGAKHNKAILRITTIQKAGSILALSMAIPVSVFN